MKQRTLCAFSLLELLVVLVIILILAAVFYPVFLTAHEGSTTSCTSNEKQILLGVLQYMQDYDERFPLGHIAAPDPLQRMGIEITHHAMKDSLLAYTKSERLFRCPLDKSPPTETLGSGPQPVRVSYAVNGWFEYGALAAQVAAPAEKVYLLERGLEGSDDLHWWQMGRHDAKSPVLEWSGVLREAMLRYVAAGRHNNTSNVGYADGHVKMAAFRAALGNQKRQQRPVALKRGLLLFLRTAFSA